MKMFIAVLILASIGNIMGLSCYSCISGSAGSVNEACEDPFDASGANVPSVDCSTLGVSFDVCAKTRATVGSVDQTTRSCFSGALCPTPNGCYTEGGGTVCCCSGDNCNGAGSVAVNIVATVAVVIAAVMFTL